MVKRLLLLNWLVVIGSFVACTADDSIVYIRASEENATEEHSGIDRKVRATLSSKFTIVNIPDNADYVQAKLISGGLPRTAFTKSGEQVSGSVWIGYVVNTEGRAVEPHVARTTVQRLDNSILDRTREWRFTPATLDGVAIQTAIASPFTFEIEETPTEFVTQILEPTGGKILRPKDWFVSDGHRANTYMWTISRESTAGKKPYRTGVRIQTFFGIKPATGKTAKQFILDFVTAKKEEATKVINVCEEQEMGLFTRICLETEEERNHILYSMFWGSDELDIAVISIAGTTSELWETYSPTFNKMERLEIIDMKRFEK